MSGHRQLTEVDSGFVFEKAGWERLDWDYVAADAIEDRKETGGHQDRHSGATFGSLPADVGAGRAADIVEGIPS